MQEYLKQYTERRETAENPDALWVELSRPNIKHNWRSTQDIVGQDITIIPMLKANAYGHGAELGKVLEEEGAKLAGVYSLREAVDLRLKDITLPILIVGYIPPDGLPIALDPRMNTSVTISHPTMLYPIEQTAQSLGTIAKVHVFVDTGMRREGVTPSEAVDLAAQIEKSPYVELEGIMTHFGDPTNPDLTKTYLQLQLLNDCLDTIEDRDIALPPYIHAAEGAAIMRVPESHRADPKKRMSAVRPGNIIYGLPPGGKDFSSYMLFTPKLALSAIKAKLAGEKVLHEGGSGIIGAAQLVT